MKVGVSSWKVGWVGKVGESGEVFRSLKSRDLRYAKEPLAEPEALCGSRFLTRVPAWVERASSDGDE